MKGMKGIKGIKGMNGSRGDEGPQGPPGRKGLPVSVIPNYQCSYFEILIGTFRREGKQWFCWTKR